MLPTHTGGCQIYLITKYNNLWVLSRLISAFSSTDLSFTIPLFSSYASLSLSLSLSLFSFCGSACCGRDMSLYPSEQEKTEHAFAYFFFS